MQKHHYFDLSPCGDAIAAAVSYCASLFCILNCNLCALHNIDAGYRYEFCIRAREGGEPLENMSRHALQFKGRDTVALCTFSDTNDDGGLAFNVSLYDSLYRALLLATVASAAAAGAMRWRCCDVPSAS
eukprot:11031-Heterococcus_DN1.PRE.4